MGTQFNYKVVKHTIESVEIFDTLCLTECAHVSLSAEDQITVLIYHRLLKVQGHTMDGLLEDLYSGDESRTPQAATIMQETLHEARDLYAQLHSLEVFR